MKSVCRNKFVSVICFLKFAIAPVLPIGILLAPRGANRMPTISGTLSVSWHVSESNVGSQGPGESQTVSQIMEEDVITVTPQTHIKDAMETMKKHKISCLPVVKNLDLVGIITINDLIGFYYD